ncbi:MAG TPA: 2Fe-2S iron-sulfur cluster-binding protein, partial [Ottowia sp.]|nr:2Fe-2S iron-sulfur cluster-binding protein [Ottowia sp.]
MANAHHDLALSPPRVHALRFPALDRDIDCAENETLFAAARRHGLRIVGACGGRGTCGSCMVRVQEGRVHREGKESEHSSHKKWLRACCVQPRSDLVADVAPRSLAPVVRADVRTGGEDQALTCEPLVAAQDLQLPPASLQDLLGDVDRVRRALAQQGQPRAVAVDWAAAAELPGLLRAHDWRVSLRSATHGGVPRIIGFARPEAPLL